MMIGQAVCACHSMEIDPAELVWSPVERVRSVTTFFAMFLCATKTSAPLSAPLQSSRRWFAGAGVEAMASLAKVGGTRRMRD